MSRERGKHVQLSRQEGRGGGGGRGGSMAHLRAEKKFHTAIRQSVAQDEATETGRTQIMKSLINHIDFNPSSNESHCRLSAKHRHNQIFILESQRGNKVPT